MLRDVPGPWRCPVLGPAPADTMTCVNPTASSTRPVRVLLYSSNAATRAHVRQAVGIRPALDLPPVQWEEYATHAAVQAAADAGGQDLLILDGEANPVGGLGICRQLKNEIFRCPPVLVLTGRPQDAWLASWSQADDAVPHPLEPFALASAVVELLRARAARTVTA